MSVFRSKKLRDAARDRPCVLCGRNNGTTVPAHSNMPEHGKGVGIKAPDYFMSYCCDRCHAEIDGRIGQLTKEEKRMQWFRAYARTVEIWFKEGLIKL